MANPVISRITAEDLHFIPQQMAEDVQQTIIQADPDTIYEVLLRCIGDGDFLRRRAAASLEYVHRWHDPLKVATQVKQTYEVAMARKKEGESA